MSQLIEQEYLYIEQEYNHISKENKIFEKDLKSKIEKYLPENFSKFNSLDLKFDTGFSYIKSRIEVNISNLKETGIFWSNSGLLRADIEFGILNSKRPGLDLVDQLFKKIDNGDSNSDIISSLKDQVTAEVNDINYGSGGHNLGETEVVINGEKKTVNITTKDIADTMSLAFGAISNISNEKLINEIKVDYLNHMVNSARAILLKNEANELKSKIEEEHKASLKRHFESIQEKLTHEDCINIISKFENSESYEHKIDLLTLTDQRKRIDIESNDKFKRDTIDFLVKHQEMRISTLLTQNGRKRYYGRLFKNGNFQEEVSLSKSDAFNLIRQSEKPDSNLLSLFKSLSEAYSREDFKGKYGNIKIKNNEQSLLDILKLKDQLSLKKRKGLKV